MLHCRYISKRQLFFHFGDTRKQQFFPIFFLETFDPSALEVCATCNPSVSQATECLRWISSPESWSWKLCPKPVDRITPWTNVRSIFWNTCVGLGMPYFCFPSIHCNVRIPCWDFLGVSEWHLLVESHHVSAPIWLGLLRSCCDLTEIPAFLNESHRLANQVYLLRLVVCYGKYVSGY